MNYIVIEYSSNRRSSIFNSVMTQQDSCEQNIHKKRYIPCILYNQCFGDGHAELILYFAAKSSRAVYEIPRSCI